jgi:hypothetical protein
MRLYSKKSLKDKEDDEDKEEATKPPASTRACSRPAGAGEGADRPVTFAELEEAVTEFGEGLVKGLKKYVEEQLRKQREELSALVGQTVGRLLSNEIGHQLTAKIALIAMDQEKKKVDLFSELRELIATTRPPDVRVVLPTEAVKVLMQPSEPPQVHVAVPEHAIRVDVEHRTLLQQAPKRTLVRKDIKYGATGRPESIEEVTEEKSVLDGGTSDET